VSEAPRNCLTVFGVDKDARFGPSGITLESLSGKRPVAIIDEGNPPLSGELSFSRAPVAENHVPADLAGGPRYVARQPILDLRGQVHGYELLYRNGPETAFRGDGNLASRTMLDNTVIFGVEKFTGGSLAFINCTAETLSGDLVGILQPNLTVLEILETVEPSPELIAACTKLKAQGFKIALDDFVWEQRFEPLVKLADYIKVDFMLTNSAGRKDLLRKLKGERVMLLAEKVESQSDYHEARSEGFTLFQGYYFCRPELIKNRKVPSNRVSHLEILRLLQVEPIDLHQLSRAVQRDESLTYRLLRMVNSARYANHKEVDSVQSAIMILGEDTFRRIATLAIATELNTGHPSELLRMAMVRARFCELASALCSLCGPEQYLLGMFSLLPGMLGVPMEALTPALPLRREIREALEGTITPEGRLLEWLKAHECGDWAACEAIVEASGFQAGQLNACYAEAVLWAESQFCLVE
jgi:c-di-GMP-related signal transduction protein